MRKRISKILVKMGCKMTYFSLRFYMRHICNPCLQKNQFSILFNKLAYMDKTLKNGGIDDLTHHKEWKDLMTWWNLYELTCLAAHAKYLKEKFNLQTERA